MEGNARYVCQACVALVDFARQGRRNELPLLKGPRRKQQSQTALTDELVPENEPGVMSVLGASTPT